MLSIAHQLIGYLRASPRKVYLTSLAVLSKEDFGAIVITRKENEHLFEISLLDHGINHPIPPVAKYCQKRPRFSALLSIPPPACVALGDVANTVIMVVCC